MGCASVIAEIAAVRDETFAAADRLLELIDQALALLPDFRGQDTVVVEALQKALCDMLETMSFQDITGQRLSRVASLIEGMQCAGISTHTSGEFSLENGPALPGDGVSQMQADALLVGEK